MALAIIAITRPDRKVTRSESAMCKLFAFFYPKLGMANVLYTPSEILENMLDF